MDPCSLWWLGFGPAAFFVSGRAFLPAFPHYSEFEWFVSAVGDGLLCIQGA